MALNVMRTVESFPDISRAMVVEKVDKYAYIWLSPIAVTIVASISVA